MAAALPPSSSLLSRTRSGRVPNRAVPNGLSGLNGLASQAAPKQSVLSPTHAAFPPASSASASTSAPTAIPIPTSFVSIFLSNLRLLDLDLRPDWPDITVRTFSAKDANQSQKKRIQSVEWALYNLFCLWDSQSEDVRKMHTLYPPADQVQSVNLRAILLRGLEQAKKTGALGRDAILRKTMLDECRGERFEEVLAVFSSAVLRRVMQTEKDQGAAAHALALEQRGYSAERTQLNGLILAHKASLSQKLRRKEEARARYKDFSELLSLKERTLVRRRELEVQLEAEEQERDEEQVSDETKRQLQRLVQNNWAGSDQWMDALLYGDERSRKDGLLSTAPDRVWRRVQAGRLGELDGGNGSGSGGLLSQLDRRMSAQKQRMQHWDDYSRRILGKSLPGTAGSSSAASNDKEVSRTTSKKQKNGIDLGFGAHDELYPPAMSVSTRKGNKPKPPHNEDYANLLQGFQADLANASKPKQSNQTPLASFLQIRKANTKPKAGHGASHSSDTDSENADSEISDIEEHPIVQQLQEHLLEQQQQQLPQQAAVPPNQLYIKHPLSASRSSVGPTSEDSNSPTRRRVLLTKSSMTFSVRSFHSDDEPEPDQYQNSPKTPFFEHPMPQAVRKLSGQMMGDGQSLAFRTRQQSPPIRPPRARATPPPPSHLQQTLPPPPPQPRTPSPDRSPPPPSPSPPGSYEKYDKYDNYDMDNSQLVSTPHSITVHPPEDALSPSSMTSPTQDLADQIMASMNNASPSPMKRPRHRLSLAQRTRMSMGIWDDELEEQDSLVIRRQDTRKEREAEMREIVSRDERRREERSVSRGREQKEQSECRETADEASRRESQSVRDKAAGYEDLVARTRRSMAGFEASRQKAQLERRRSQRMRPSIAPAPAAKTFDSIDEDNSVLAEDLIGQDDAEAIFRSRPKIKMSPIPSPTRELEYD